MTIDAANARTPVPRLPTARRHAAGGGDRVARWLPHAAAVVIVTLVGLPTLIIPFWYDSAIFAAIGKAISNGGYPYVDAWDQKPPAIYLIYALAIHGPFGFMANVRLFDLLWMAATVALIVELGRRWWSARAGLLAGITFGVVYFTVSGAWQSAQPDSFIGLPLLAALLLYEQGRGRWAWLIAAGLLLGFAFQLRFIAAPLIPFFPLVELAGLPRGRWLRAWLQRMVALGVGFLLFQGAIVGWLAWGGALGEYIAATRFASGYTRLGGPWQGPEGPTTTAYLQAVRLSFPIWANGRAVLTLPALVGAFASVFVARDRRAGQMALFCLLAYAGISAQAKFFWYHYGLMLPFLALLAGWTWDVVLRAVERARSRGAAALAGTLAATLLLLATPEVTDWGWVQWQRAIDYTRRPETREEFETYFPGWIEARQMADYVRERTAPGDYIHVWGYDPIIYLLADRPNSSRFTYAFPLMSDWAPARWQADFIEELRARPPVYFIAQRGQGGVWITGHTIDPVDYIAWYPALESWLNDGYEQETELWPYVVYRRRA